MKNDKTILFAIIGFIIMFVLYGLSSSGYLGDNPVGQTASYVNPLIVPAGYAFSIWSIIYLGLIIFPFYQWKQGNRTSIQWQKVRVLYSINVILNGVWLAFASYSWLILSVIVIVGMLITLYMINEQLIRIEQEGQPLNYWIEKLVFSIYFAWITLATVLNVSSALSFYKWNGFGISEVMWSYIILPIVAIIAGFVVKKYRSLPYAAVVIWAFMAIFVKHRGTLESLSYLAVSIALIYFIYILNDLRLRAASKNFSPF